MKWHSLEKGFGAYQQLTIDRCGAISTDLNALVRVEGRFAFRLVLLTPALYASGQVIYLKDVLTRLPTQRASEINELLPHKWVKSRD